MTEDRKNSGLLPAMSVLHNLTIIIIRALSFLRGLFIRDAEETQSFATIRARLDIKLAGPGQRIIYLSGGNQQKVLIGRTLLTDCKALILLEPTRGIDVGAKAEIHRILRELADKGHVDHPHLLGTARAGEPARPLHRAVQGTEGRGVHPRDHGQREAGGRPDRPRGRDAGARP